MEAVLITIYLIVVLALIAVILLQRSEGGGLGMGSANSNGLMTVRGSANVLTRTTAILATLFMATAIGLTIMTEINRPAQSILQRAVDGIGEGADAPTTVLDALNALQGDSGLAIPQTQAPAGTSDVGSGPTNPAADPGLAVPEFNEPAAGAGEAGDGQSTGETPAAPVN